FAILADCQPAIVTRAPGLPPTGKISSTPSGLYPAFDDVSCSPRPALCYRALLALRRSSCLSCTPDVLVAQSSYASLLPSAEGDLAWPPDAAPTGKTSETVKEQLCFTPSIFWVNRKNEFVCALISIECRSFTGVCSESGANETLGEIKQLRDAANLGAFRGVFLTS